MSAIYPDAMVCSLDSNKGLPLCKASRYGHVESVQFLLDRGAPVNAESSVDPNALTLASLKNYSEVVKVLLDHGASVSARGSRGRTALSLAAENGCVEAGKLLLDYGADVDSAEHDDRERGFTPLMYAAHKGHYKMVELLIKHHASINKKDLNGQTAIMYAQKAGASWIVGSLLNNQVDLQNVDSHGVTLLMMACAIKDLRNVRRLVDEKHVSLDTVDHHGRTAFHYACLAGTNEIIEYLLGKGVDINHTDHLGRSGLMLVLEDENCDGSIVNILWNKSDPKSTDKYGRTALMYAISWSNLNIINNMLHMADIHIKDLEGNTALDQCLHQYSNNSLFVGIQNNKIAKVSSHFSFDQVFAEAFGETAKSAHKLLRDRVNEVKQFLRPAIEEFLKKEAFINYLAQRECVGSDVILEDISKNLERYSTDHSIIMAFVDFDLRDKVSDGGWAHLMTLQALARLKVMTLYCWEEIEGDLILRQRVNNDMPPGNSTRRDILLRRGYRFDLINFGRFKDDIPSTPDSPERILSEVFGSNRRWAHEHLTNRIGSFRWFLKRAIKEFLKKEVFFNYLVQREFLGSEITLEDISKNLEHYSSDHSILMAFIDYDLRDKVTDGGWPHLITLQVLAWTHKITLDCYEEKGGDLVMCQNDIRSEKTRIRHILRRRGYHFDQIKFEVIKDDIPPTADMPEYPLKRVHVAKKFSCDVIKRLVESGCTITLEKRAEFKKESLLALDSIQESIQQSIQQERERLNANINIWSRFFSGQNPYANTPPNNTLVLKK
jgi:ankyrin repeat protein